MTNHMEKTPKVCTNVVLKLGRVLRYNEKGGSPYAIHLFYARTGLPGRVLCCYICSGTVILNMVSTLKITCFTARHRAMRACRVAGSASRMRQLL